MEETPKIGRYTILNKIGSGGMGIVFRAHDPFLRRDVALKLMQPFILDDEKLQSRFIREARLAARLQHPNIVVTHDLGLQGDVPYIAMELLSGSALSHLIQTSARLDLDTAVEYVSQLCSGLEYAHAKGLVHRDIKPANLFITDEGTVKLLDFGLARLSTSDFTSVAGMGTPAYAAPEQIRGEKVDGRADLFSVGAVLYEMICGRRAFGAESSQAAIHRILYGSPEPIGKLIPLCPPNITNCIERALQKDPSKRYQSARELRADLRPVVLSQLGTKHRLLKRLKSQYITIVTFGAIGVSGALYPQSIILGLQALHLKRPNPLIRYSSWIYEQRLRYSAEHGDADAQYALYKLLQSSDIANTESVRWLRRAAEGDNIDAQYRLGLLAEDEEDYSEAVHWFRKAAARGNTGAQYSLGAAYEIGKGVAQDEYTAWRWYYEAAKAGDITSGFSAESLATMALHKDENLEAAEWLFIAQEYGTCFGCWKGPSSHLSHDEVELARSRAEDWVRWHPKQIRK